MSVDPVTSLLRCPVTGENLRWMDDASREKANRHIAAGELKHLDGSAVAKSLDRAVVNDQGTLAYRWDSGIFALLADLAIALTQDATPGYTASEEKKAAQAFYNEFGWQKSGDLFKDTERFEDTRPVSADYIHRCHVRVGRHLPKQGAYLLDVASGPVQFPEYEAYSQNFEKRVCVDLSLAALRAAQEKLGKRAIYLLGDITRLPIRDDACDAGISLHTIYHVPADEQRKAFHELRRAVRSDGPALVVYNWGHHCFMMEVAMLPFKLIKWPGQLVRRLTKGRKKRKNAKGGLYYHPHPPAWVRAELTDLRPEFRAWRSVSVPWLRKYVQPWLLGRLLLRMVFRAEETCPNLAGRFGQYPLIVLSKPKR